MTRQKHTLLVVVACLLGLASCSSSHHADTTSGATRRASTTTNGHRSTAASLFAAAYVRFLDGAGAAGTLPNATTAVRKLAEQAAPIPAARRRGTLVMTELRPAVGASDSYLLAARDDAHTFYAQLTLGEQHGQWLVVQLTPPDLVQTSAPAGPGTPPPPAGSSGAEAAARLFLRGYLPWLYGQAPLQTVAGATHELLASLKAHPPRVPLTMRSLRPKVEAIAMQRRGRGWQALPSISDGRETYELVLTITRTHDGWLVTQVSSQTR